MVPKTDTVLQYLYWKRQIAASPAARQLLQWDYKAAVSP